MKWRGEDMRKQYQDFRRWFALCLTMMMLVTGLIPALPASAATNTNNPITLTGFPNDTSAANPVVYGDSRLTITGTYGASVSGPSLRLKLITNNGQIVQDLANTAPEINGSNFTFTDVSLKSGLNKITFYERVGSVTKEYYHFYVQYNDTPLVSDLKINDVPLNDPNITTNPTYIAISSINRLTLSMDGKALNADSVEVRNLRNNEVVRSEVNRSGTFGLNIPSLLGENTLHIRVFNQNKEVGVFERKILVTATSSGSSDQFYQVKLDSVLLNPDMQAVIKQAATTSSEVAITGKALLRFIDIDKLQKFDQFRLTITGDGYNQIVPVTLNASVSPTAPAQIGFAPVGNPQNGFTEYYISARVPAGLEDGKVYRVSLSYQYLVKVSSDDPNAQPTTPNGFTLVNNYQYQFKYVDSRKPIIEKVVNLVNSQQLSPTGTNTIVTSPLELQLQTLNANTIGGFAIKYNGVTLNQTDGDYSLVQVTGTDAPAAPAYYYNLTLKKTPPGNGKLEILYTSGSDSASGTYQLDIRVTPYVQLTYMVDGQVRSFEDGFEIKSANDIRSLDGRVYNYVLKTNNIKATLNSSPVTITGINTTTGVFRIADTQLNYKKGNNVLKIILSDDTNKDTNTTFTYNVSYDTSVAPSVEDVKLEIVSNGETEELVKKAGDSAYRTGANFLRGLSFTVKDATHVYIEKNGKRINDFEYDNGTWDQIDTHQDYVNARQEATLNDNDLADIFDRRNISPISSTKFEGKITASQYGDLVERVQDAVTDAQMQEQKLALFPLTLRKGGTTVYTIVAEDDNGTVVRYDINIEQKYSSWEVLSPVKAKETDQYIIVNSNTAIVRVFAENADKVLFGKTEATVSNTTNRDFYYDDDLGKTIPETYYVFTATVPLKKGLNTVKFAIQVGTETYNDEVKIYNANSTVNGAEYRDVLGKKVSFTVFDKQLVLKFPSGTVLLSPDDGRAGQEVKNPNGDIFVDVPLYFGIADRTTGQVSLPDDNLENRLVLDANFNYASPLYYIDAGDIEAPWGRDPYYDEGNAEDFKSRWEDNLVPSRQGTLTLQYNSSIVNAANTMLTIYYHNGDEWRNVGGVVNTGSQTVQVPFQGFGFYMVMKTRESYDDVVSHDFARDAMETLYAKGIMPAYSGSSFGANRDMTRGEFATMLVKALALPIDAGPYRDSNERDPLEPTFTDVRPNRDRWDYEYKYIETAARAGIIRGKQPGYFRPDESLTREEATIMIARALNLKLGSLDASKLALNKSFTDAKDVSYYAAPSVLAVTKAKLMNGEPNDATAKKPTFSFKPRNNLTRAEMAVITVRVMVQMKKLPKQ